MFKIECFTLLKGKIRLYRILIFTLYKYKISMVIEFFAPAQLKFLGLQRRVLIQITIPCMYVLYKQLMTYFEMLFKLNSPLFIKSCNCYLHNVPRVKTYSCNLFKFSFIFVVGCFHHIHFIRHYIRIYYFVTSYPSFLRGPLFSQKKRVFNMILMTFL